MTTLSTLRAEQTPSTEVRGSLVAAFQLRGCQAPEDLFALDALAKEHGLSLFYGGGDAESTEDDDDFVTLYPWLLGVEIHAVTGGVEQATGFDLAPGGPVALAQKGLLAHAPAVEALCAQRGLSCEGPAAFLVARGGLALAMLAKGVWIDAPEDIAGSFDDLHQWLEKRLPPEDRGEVGYHHGTRGCSQEPYPAVVHGVVVASADAEARRLDLPLDRVAAIDEKLRAAGIGGATYFLLIRYD